MTKQHKIIEAARQRFRYYGVSKTTMQEIARDSGVAVGTLYLYFQNKDALVVACAEQFARRHAERARTILASRAAADRKLKAYVVDRFRQSAKTRRGSRHASEITRAVLRVKPDRIAEETRMMHETITAMLAEGVAQRLFRIARPAADAEIFLFAIAIFFPSALTETPRAPQEADLIRVVDWFLSAWKAGPSATRRRRPGRAPSGQACRPGRSES